MRDFHARLIAEAEKLGAQHVRLEPPGAGEHDGRFRSHPHLAGSVAGKPFRYPVPLRPKDTPRRWLNSVAGLRRLLIELGASPPQPPAGSPVTRRRRRTRRLLRQPPSGLKVPSVPAGPTRLSQDPWSALRPLRQRLVASQNHPHYVAGPFKEQPLLEELIAAEPPVGGVAAYVADFNGEYDPSEE